MTDRTGSAALTLARIDVLHVAAWQDGLRLSFDELSHVADARDWTVLETWPAKVLAARGGQATALDLAVLMEQGRVQSESGSVFIATEDVAGAMVDGVALATRFTEPSPFLLQVDREGDLGRPTFAYRYVWLHGAHQVGLRRFGAYVRHEATHRVYHLDPRTVAMVEAMDDFNATPPAERTPAALWGTFARVRADAEAVGAELDAHLTSNTVVIPSQLLAEVREHNDGSISFVPRCPELPGDELGDAFLKSRAAQAAYSITRPDGTRVRVIMEPRHQTVLERMTHVRRATGETRTRALSEPEAVFDGVLADVELSFGERVTGIGAFQFGPEPTNPRTGSFLESLVGERDAAVDEGSADPSANNGGAATVDDRALPASIVLPLADGTGDITVRFESGQQVSDFRSTAEAAHARGEEAISWKGESLEVEPAVLEALGGIGVSGRAPSRGRDGRLYLIIYDNDETLREADVERAAEAKAVPVEVAPVRMPRALRPDVILRQHQHEGVRWLDTCRAVQGRSGVLLADDMGLGKTLQVLVHLANVIESGGLADHAGQRDGPPWRPILIVAPLILVENDTWTTEMATRFLDGGAVFQPVLKLYGNGIRAVMSDEGDHDPLGASRLDPAKLMSYRVVITTYETLVNYQHSLARHINGRPLWSVVISDEAQRAKSMRTKVSVALKAVTPGFHVAATGTPVENRLLDLWNLIDTVQPGLLGTARDFSTTYEAPLSKGVEAQHSTLEALRAELLFGAPHAFLIRRNKTELTDLPPKVEQIIECPMEPEEVERQAAVIGALSRPGVGRQTLRLLQELARLSQHPLLGDDALLAQNPAQIIAASAKLRETLRVIDDIAARGEKVIIFARLVAAQQLLARVIGNRYGLHVDVLNGETKRTGGRDVRRLVLDRFRRSPGFGAIVLSPFVAGVGLTITEANHVIHYGRWWNPAVEDQATDRAYRIGQTRPVTVYYPILRDTAGRLPHGTFDEALHALVVRKREVARDFLHPVIANDDRDAAEMRDTLVGERERVADDKSDVKLDAADIATMGVRELSALVAASERVSGRRVALLPVDGYAGAHVLSVGPNGARVTLVRCGMTGVGSAVTDATAATEAVRRLHAADWHTLVVLTQTGGSLPDTVDVRVEVLNEAALVSLAKSQDVSRADVALELATAPANLQESLALLFPELYHDK